MEALAPCRRRRKRRFVIQVIQSAVLSLLLSLAYVGHFSDASILSARSGEREKHAGVQPIRTWFKCKLQHVLSSGYK